MTIKSLGVTFDARDAKMVATFWAAALGRSLAAGADAINASLVADRAARIPDRIPSST